MVDQMADSWVVQRAANLVDLLVDQLVDLKVDYWVVQKAGLLADLMGPSSAESSVVQLADEKAD